MAEVTLELIKTLREQTGAGMMDCKGALKESDGDLEAAATYLRKKGIARADKKAGRAASEGVVASRVATCGKTGLLIEANCETDFVAKNENFQEFVENLLDQVESAGDIESHEALLALPYIKDESSSFEEYIKATAGALGENISLSRSIHDTLSGEGAVASYIHMGGKVGVLIEVTCGKAETAQSDVFKNLVNDLNLHIAAIAPLCLTREEIPADIVAKEEEVYRDQMNDKPAKIVDNIIKGMLNKFYSQSAFLEQAFVKDGDTTVGKLIEKVGKELDDTIEVARFTRYARGENAPEGTDED